MPLRSTDKPGHRMNVKRLVQLARRVVLGLGPPHQLHAWVERRQGRRIPVMNRSGVSLRNLIIEPNLCVATIEPPAGDLVSVAVGPFLNHARPTAGKRLIDWLVSVPCPQAERFLRLHVLIGCLAGQVQHQPDAALLDCLEEGKRQVAHGQALTWFVTCNPLVCHVRRIVIAGILAEREHKILCPRRLDLLRQGLHVERVNLRQPSGTIGQEVHEQPVPCVAQPVGAG